MRSEHRPGHRMAHWPADAVSTAGAPTRQYDTGSAGGERVADAECGGQWVFPLSLVFTRSFVFSPRQT